MDAQELARKLQEGDSVPASSAESVVPNRPGYYSIWIDDPTHLPADYAKHLETRGANLLYVGIATKSLLKRLVKSLSQNSSLLRSAMHPGILRCRDQKGPRRPNEAASGLFGPGARRARSRAASCRLGPPRSGGRSGRLTSLATGVSLG